MVMAENQLLWVIYTVMETSSPFLIATEMFFLSCQAHVLVINMILELLVIVSYLFIFVRHSFSVTAFCDNGTVRLAQGPKASVGRVEVCVEGTWRTVCSEFMSNADASVICKSLGYSPYG